MIRENKKNLKKFVGLLLFFLILAGLSFFASKLVLAQSTPESEDAAAAEYQAYQTAQEAKEKAANIAVQICKNAAGKSCTNPAQALGYWTCPQGVTEMLSCIAMMQKENADLINQESWKQLTKETEKAARNEKIKEVLATSFRNSLSAFSRQIAHDTAVWVASGGKGQQPLFITEGWGAYLQNAADSALGDFIDNIGQSYGVDLCKPDISIRIAIETGINWQQPRKVRCTFTQMMNNWESAVSNPNFSFEYTNSMRPGENDVSVFLQLQSRAFQTVAWNSKVKEKEGDTNSLFKDVKDLAGKILTPGTAVADAFRDAVKPTSNNASFGYETFTGTIADIIEEFLNTLVSELLKNLQSGLFSSGSSSSEDEQPFEMPDLSALFNPNASPRTYEGAAGAEERFRSLIAAKTKVGGPYDILTKLTICTEQSKSNLGPTDCVIDPILSEAIRQKTQVKDLPKEILDRPFAPMISDVANPQVAFTERNIKILRKYRIVPVGWEIVAEQIKPLKKEYTLGDVMKDSNFKQYIDPYWVLEAPELFCRQTGYGAHNSSAGSQDGSINRDEYCADEQQCIQQNDSGNCTAYGYCTEERRYWDLADGKTCAPRYNTCETFSGRDNLKDSWLVNSLDFRNCNETNYGCRWLSAAYNNVDNTWTHLEPEKTMDKCPLEGGCTKTVVATSPVVKQGHFMSEGSALIMTQPCSASACAAENLISNGGFEDSMTSAGSGWTWFDSAGGVKTIDVKTAITAGILSTHNLDGTPDAYHDVATVNFFLATTTDSITGASAHSGQQMFIFRNPVPVGYKVLTHTPITLKAGKKYVFSAYVNYANGGNTLNAYIDLGNDLPTNDNSNFYAVSVGGWQRLYKEYEITSAADVEVNPRLVVDEPGPGGYVYFDDVQLQEVGTGRCTYNEESRTCTFYQGECTIPNGGVMCAVTNCQIGSNLLANFNSGFEDADGTVQFRPAKWNFTNSYYNLDNRLYREQKQGASGYNLVGKSSGSTIPLFVKLDTVSVTPGKRYALKFKLKGDYINQGGLAISIHEKDNDSSIRGLSFQFLPSFWQDYSFEFDAPETVSTTYIKINIPAYSKLLVYADDFELKEVDKTCNANSVWLTNGMATTTDKEIYFNAQASACDGSAEGCSQFIRTKAGLGSNLIVNGSFNQATSGWEFLGGSFSYITDGNKNYAKMSYNAATYRDFKVIDIMPGTYYMISMEAAQTGASANKEAKFEMFFGTSTSHVSGDGIKVLNTDCASGGNNTITFKFNPASTTLEKKFCKFLAPAGAYALRYKVFAGDALGDEVYVDNIKLEAVNYNVDLPSEYTDYNPNLRPANQLAYLKKASDFFSCYRDSSGKWADRGTLWGILAGRQPACQDYAPVCTSDEVGCELYRPVSGDPAVPGIVDALDVCPAECAGYSVYRQEETSFVSSKYRQFIGDSKLKSCSAAYAGCDEFTNLDKLGEGAEAREYYVSFRACQKPGVNDPTYYTWEGSDVTGYQLKIYKLKKSQIPINDPVSSGYAPCTYLRYTGANSSVCEDNNTAGTPGNAGYCTREQMFSNPDCREFYSATDGTVSYRLLSRTISISDDCHPYRRTQTQTATEETQNDCNIKQGYWNGAACVYMAIPQQGRTCPASLKGCREFTGNRANNVRNLIKSDFGTDSVSTSSWQDAVGGTSELQISTESSFVGGYSISNTAGNGKMIKHPVSIQKGKAYVLSFWAKADAGTGAFFFAAPGSSVKFKSAPDVADSVFSLAASTGGDLANTAPEVTLDWKKFDLGPVFVTEDWTLSDDEYLEFHLPTGKKVYLDNVILKEVREDIFAVDNSWFTPLACDNKLGDANGQKAIEAGSCTPITGSVQGTRCFPGEMLGCAAYKDRAEQLNYFKSFARLCRQEAAGCEALIDTYNYSPAESKVFNAGDKSSTTVPADELIYLVNDRQYACNAGDKGCTAYGLPIISKYEEVAGYNTVYLLNNPDLYNRTLCKFNEVWCDQYIGPASIRYFKNPHGRVCQYEIKPGQLEGYWYIAGTDELCSTTMDQTLGKGYGTPKDKIQPVGVINNVTGDGPASTSYAGWVGACPASQNGCSEYIDPLPAIYTPVKIENEEATIKRNTLYVVRGADSIGLTVAAGMEVVERIVYPDNSSDNTIKRFYISCPPEKYTECKNENTKIGISGQAFLAPAGVYYTFANALDRGSCQGQVNFDTGCVLFNERRTMDYASSTSWIDRISQYLSYDAYATYVKNRNITTDPAGNETAGAITRTAPLSGQNDSNVILKVRPDRTCNTWLNCTTYEKKEDNASALFAANDKCLALGLCDSFSEQGICNHFVSSTPTSTYDLLRDINKTGYSYFGQGNNGYYSYELMTQEAEAANIVNGNFESIFGSSGLQPLGWQTANYNCIAGAKLCSTGYPRLRYDAKVLGNEILIKADARAAKEGFGSLQINTGNAAISEDTELDSNTEYILSAWVDTSNLTGPGDISTAVANPARAEIQLRFFDKVGNITTTGMTMLDINGVPVDPALYAGHYSNTAFSDVLEGGWFYDSSLRVPAGLPWKQIIFRFRTGVNVNRMSFALMNMNPDTAANYDNTKLTGHTLWDDFQLKPLLKANDNKLVNRTCRIYPDQGAQSCKYISGNNAFYGLYGYCLLDDPANPGQCLQWWPVDSIKGEVLDDFDSYYQERAPLYYCIHKARKEMTISGSSVGLEVNEEELPEELGSLEDTGATQDVPFSVVPSAYPTFRYPFIYKFWANVVAVGVGLGEETIGATAFTGTMYPKRMCAYAGLGMLDDGLLCYKASKREPPSSSAGGSISCDFNPLGLGLWCWLVNLVRGVWNLVVDFIQNIVDMLVNLLILTPEDYWGGFGVLGIATNTGGAFTVAIPVAMPWHEAMAFNNGSGIVYGLLSLFGDSGIGGGIVGVRIITDDDSGDLSDPMPSVSGDILGYSTFLSGGQVYGVSSIVNLGGNFIMEYCDRVVKVVNSTGQNKAWATRLTPGSSYQSKDSDCVGDSLDSSDNPKCFYRSRYCLYTDCLLNPDRVCDFCSNLVGKIVNGHINNMPVSGSVTIMDNVACPEYPGDINAATGNMSTVAGRVYKGGKECKDLFSIGGYIYSRIYSNNYFTYGVDYRPYGSLVAPSNAQFPQLWDSRPEAEGKQPLYYELPMVDMAAPYQARMGQEHSRNQLKRLFAQTYGVWRYDTGANSYVATTSGGWSLPACYCDGYVRPNTEAFNYCLVRPQITNFQRENISAAENGEDSGTPVVTRIKFNIIIDPDQVPIRMYSVNWGDGSATTSYSGISLLPRPASSTATMSSNYFTLYHFYNRAGMSNPGDTSISITVKDNWNAQITRTWKVDLQTSNGVVAEIPFSYATAGQCDSDDPVDPEELPFVEGGPLRYGDTISLYNVDDSGYKRRVYYGGNVAGDKDDDSGNHVRLTNAGNENMCGVFDCGTSPTSSWKSFVVYNAEGEMGNGETVKFKDIVTLWPVHNPASQQYDTDGNTVDNYWMSGSIYLSARDEGASNIYMNEDIDRQLPAGWERFSFILTTNPSSLGMIYKGSSTRVYIHRNGSFWNAHYTGTNAPEIWGEMTGSNKEVFIIEPGE